MPRERRQPRAHGVLNRDDFPREQCFAVKCSCNNDATGNFADLFNATHYVMHMPTMHVLHIDVHFNLEARMIKTGGIIGIIAGLLGILAAVVTLFMGGVGASLEASGAKSAISSGWYGIGISLLVIIASGFIFFRPRQASIAVIVLSLAGAILGGILVAVCMGLSLIGGVLAMIGLHKKGNEVDSIVSASVPLDIKHKKNAWLKIGAGTIALVMVFAVIGIQGKAGSSSHQAEELASLPPSNLHIEGELSDMFSIDSQYTNLQRENKLKEITGKIVQWRLPVYEVSRSGSIYKVQTAPGFSQDENSKNLAQAIVYLTPEGDEDRRKIEALKADDMLEFKGRISGASMRRLEIKPAILVVSQKKSPTPVPANASAMQSAPVAESANLQDIKPSFDCGKASNNVEQTICSNRELAELDGEMKQAYDWLAGSTSDKQSLQKKQSEWRKTQRDVCSTTDCIAEAYRSRTRELAEEAQYLSKPAEFR